MDAEIQAIKRNDTWELVDPLPNCKIVGVKWIFKTKLKEIEEIDKFKARLVAKGYTAFPYGEINEDVYLEQPLGTQNLGIFYKDGGNEELLAYTYSDYARDLTIERTHLN
ncbi:putative mitochondrial protein, partial [Mucuna pruriens]